MNHKQFGILLLILALAVAVGYIGYTEFQKYRIRIYQQGIQDAGNFISNQLIAEALQCKPLTFNYIDNNNQTQQINLIAIECLNQNNIERG